MICIVCSKPACVVASRYVRHNNLGETCQVGFCKKCFGSTKALVDLRC
jgi:hypothetical protein